MTVWDDLPLNRNNRMPGGLSTNLTEIIRSSADKKEQPAAMWQAALLWQL